MYSITNNKIYNSLLILFYVSLSIITGTLLSQYTNNLKFIILNYFIYVSIGILYLLINKNMYIEFIVSIFIILTLLIGMIMTIINNTMFLNNVNSNIFFWLLFLASFISIIGFIITTKLINKLYNKTSPLGDKGPQGPRGLKGEKSNTNMVMKDIIFNQLIEHSQSYIKLKTNNDNNNIKNINFIEKIKSVSYSIKLKKKIFEVNNLHNPEDDCKNKGIILQNIIDNLKIDIEDIIDNFLKYDNGLKFLQNSFYIEEQWETLYTINDKNNKLPENPYIFFNNINEI